MSFLTERFYQILDDHKVYEHVNSLQNLKLFMERHVICVWGYNALMRSLQQDFIKNAQPLNSEPFKEGLRLINELVLDEEVDDLGDGRIVSHLELYLEAMEEIGCDMAPILGFFDLLESGIKPRTALRTANFPPEVVSFGEFIVRCLGKPLHLRATVLFYEGEPFIPDKFLRRLELISPKSKVTKLLDYLERHIEGLKRPGFSSAGRLVELLCLGDTKLNRQAEKVAEATMKKRIELWNSIALLLAEDTSDPSFVLNIRQNNLRLVT